MVENKPTRKNGLPEKINVLIIGGGVIGCNVAYHLVLKSFGG
jgi:glycerol-3-phosphate dehydrogenase